MTHVETSFFVSQIKQLAKKYPRIQGDIDDFYDNIDSETSGIELSHDLWKFRLKNTSIPTGKRGGFRLIAKKYGEKWYPFLIYAKTMKENVSTQEIEEAYERMIQSL